MSDRIPFYSNYPRTTIDPIGTKSEEKVNLQNALVVSYANALSGSLASNYLSEYGSNNRILYENVGKILTNLLLDSIDLIDETDYSFIRSEFFNDRLYQLLFPNDKLNSVNNDTELKEIILNLIQSLLQGSTGKAISDLLNKTAKNSVVSLSEIGDFLIECLISFYSITSITNDHQHYVNSPIKGLGKTSAPIGYKWGDNLHQHDVLDGIIQTADNHTHEIVYGFQQNIIELQETLYQLLLKTKPAHVNISSRPSSIVKEDLNKPSFDFTLSMGLMFQEDLRKTDYGIYQSSVYGYTLANSKYLRVYDSGFRVNDRIRINNQERKIVGISYVLADDIPEVTYTVPRLGNIGLGQILNNCLIVPEPSGFVNTDYEMQEGEMVIIGTTAYFILKVNPYTYKLSAQILTLDRPLSSTTADLYLIENLQSSFKTRNIRYKKYNQTFSSLTSQFILPYSTPYTIYGMPILPKDFITDADVKEYNPFSRLVTLNNAVTEIEISYPYDETDEVCFTALNDVDFVLNSYRPINQRSPDNLLPTNRLNKKNAQTLFKHNKKYPYIKERIRAYYSHSYTEGLNNSSFILNQNASVSYKKSKLNRYNVVNSVPRVTKTAIATLAVKDGKIVLPFKPERILSVKQGTTEVSTYKIRGIEVILDLIDGVLVTVTALTNKTISEGDWYRPEELNEGMIPFKNIVKQEEFNVDEFMENPLGNATLIEKPRQTYIKEEIKDNSGIRSEFSFFKDELFHLEQSFIYEETVVLFNGGSNINNMPLSLNIGNLNLGQYVLNNNPNVIIDGSAIVEILLIPV